MTPAAASAVFPEALPGKIYCEGAIYTKFLTLPIRLSVIDELLEKSKNSQRSKFDTLHENIISVSPILDYTPEIGIVSIMVPVEKNGQIAHEQYIVTSDRNAFHLEETKKGLQIGEKRLLLRDHKLMEVFENRWKPEDARRFLNGESLDALNTYDDVVRLFDKYIQLNDPVDAHILSVWVMGTYLYPLFDAYPYLNFTGPKGSGKTKTLELCIRGSFNGMVTSNISIAALFRSIEVIRPTIGIDEAERLTNQRDPHAQELRQILNSGYKKGQPAIRCVGDDHEPKSFEVYSPKIIAGIQGVDDVLQSRCIRLNFLRADPDNPVGRTVINDSSEDWSAIRHQLYVFGLSHFKSMTQNYADQAILGDLNNRAAELWRPLLAISKTLDPNGAIGLYNTVYQYALEYTQGAQESAIDDNLVVLIIALNELTSRGEKELMPKQIYLQMEAHMNREVYLNIDAQWVGYRLLELGLKRARRKSTGSAYEVTAEQVLDIARRYGIEF